jgi:hypothetical protein
LRFTTTHTNIPRTPPPPAPARAGGGRPPNLSHKRYETLNTLYSTVSIATECGLDDLGLGVWVPVGSRIIISSLHCPRPVPGPTLPPFQWVPGVRRPLREADRSPPTSADVKKTWIYISNSPYVFMA